MEIDCDRHLEPNAPVLARIKARLDTDSIEGKLMPSSPLAIAVNYTAKIWPKLARYAEAGNWTVEIESWASGESGDRPS